MTRLIIPFILLLSLLTPVRVQATESTMSASTQTAFKQGLAAAEQGDWETAIKYFSEAREATPNSPQVLFNLALACAKAGGRDVLAIAWFRAYLAAAPNTANAEQVRVQISQLEANVQERIQKLFQAAIKAASQIPEDVALLHNASGPSS